MATAGSDRFGRGALLASGGARIDPVLPGDHAAEQDEGAGRQDRDQEAGVVFAKEMQRLQAGEDHVDAGEQGPGADQLPQAAEEINIPLKKIGKILILSVVCAVILTVACVLL